MAIQSWAPIKKKLLRNQGLFSFLKSFEVIQKNFHRVLTFLALPAVHYWLTVCSLKYLLRNASALETSDMVFEYASYRSFLKNELAQRTASNSSYSLRAFAKNLGITPSMLSEVMKAKKNLSKDAAQAIAEKLALSEKQSEYFVSLVEYELVKNEALKEKIRARMELLNPRKIASDLNLEVFKAISSWYHIALLEAVNLEHAPKDATDFAQCLGISRAEAEAALDRLVEIELIEKTAGGKFRKVKGNLIAKSKQPNLALRKFHAQMLGKAVEALEQQSNQEKFVGSETLAFDSDLLKDAEAAFEECFAKIVKLSAKSKKKDAVYHVGIQFFKTARGMTSL